MEGRENNDRRGRELKEHRKGRKATEARCKRRPQKKVKKGGRRRKKGRSEENGKGTIRSRGREGNQWDNEIEEEGEMIRKEKLKTEEEEK